MALWESETINILLNSDFGWLGNLLPLTLAIGISWGISRKGVDMLFMFFIINLCLKLIFPFYHNAFVIISFALFIMNIVGSKGDIIAEAKSIPEVTRALFTTAKNDKNGKKI